VTRVKRRKEEHINHDRWLVSYADFITLLFAFFVVLYALSQADAKKFKEVAESLNRSLKGPPSHAPTGPKGGEGAGDFPGEPVISGAESAARAEAEAHAQAETRASLQSGLLEGADSIERVALVSTPGERRAASVRVTVSDLFADRSITAREELLPILDRMGRIIAANHDRIWIDGHSEVSEERSGETSALNGWDLSASRAAWIARYWIQKFGVDPSRLVVSGYSHFHPHATGDGKTEWSRGLNRSIEVVFEPVVPVAPVSRSAPPALPSK
jgi:chemotaxis protein MotB